MPSCSLYTYYVNIYWLRTLVAKSSILHIQISFVRLTFQFMNHVLHCMPIYLEIIDELKALSLYIKDYCVIL